MLQKWMESTPNPTWNMLQKAIAGLSDDAGSKGSYELLYLRLILPMH